MAVEIITSFDQQCDSAGDPMSGAKIYVYDVGTTTLRNIYSDTGLSAAAANPIVTDSVGRHDMRYTATGSYKIVVKTSADVTVYTRDNVDGRVPVGSGALAIANGGTGQTTAAAAIAALGGSTAAEVADIAADVASLQGTLASTEKTHIATGTVAQRPGSPIQGDIRCQIDDDVYEGYTGSAWVNFVTVATGQSDYSASDTLEGLIELAVQTEMKTGTDVVRAVTPGRQQFHKSAAKCWAKFDYAASWADVYNITSNTDVGTGAIGVTIATDFSSAAWVALALTATNGAISTATVNTTVAQDAGTVRLSSWDAGNALSDTVNMYFAGFGDQ